MKNALLFIFAMGIIALIIMTYQNCGDIKLNLPKAGKQSSYMQLQHSVTVDFCIPQENGITYDLFGSPLAINLNAIPYQGNYQSDSDADGLADSIEGPFDPLNSHSQNILDYICFKAGQCSSTCTNNNYFSLGLTECDIQAYSNLQGSYNNFDSNSDSIPDFVAIIRKGDPFRNAALGINQNGRSLAEEILNQTDPEWLGAGRPDFRPMVSRLDNNDSCLFPAKHYSITTQNQPFVPVKSYTDNYSMTLAGRSFNLSHRENENIIGIFISTYSLSGNPTIHRGYFYLGRIQDSTAQSINVRTTDFVKAGEWQ